MRNAIFVAIATALVGSTALVATDAGAGEQLPAPEQCMNTSTGGNCFGTFVGFRNGASPNDTAFFQFTAPGFLEFLASYKGAAFTCIVPSSSPLSASLPAAVAARGLFEITWNTAGVCTSLVLENSSQYVETW